MKAHSTRLGIVLLISCLPLAAAAQGKPSGGGGGRTTGGNVGTTLSRPTTPGMSIPSPDTNFPSPTFLSGKVRTDDGTPLTESAIIQTSCLGAIRNEGYTDNKGNFSFDLQSSSSSAMVQDVEANSQPAPGMRGGSTNSARRRDLRQCSLQAVLPGFRSDSIELAAKANDTGTADVGTIILHRMARVEGLTISVTSAAAPPKAKKEFDKGRDEERKSKFEGAEQHFAKAVEIYPKYAVAWNELGRMQFQRSDADAAKSSFQKAIDADPKYVNPYGGMVEIGLKNQQWKDVAAMSGKIVELNPVDFPQYWFDNSLANYFLQNMELAQTSAERGLGIDTQHHVPRLEYLLGMILAKKSDYAAALTHVQNYLRMVPNPSDHDVIQKQIAELQKLTTTSQLKQ